MVNIDKLNKILNENFNLSKWQKKVEDKRKRPIIHPGTIFKLIMEMVFFGQKSLLEVDEFGENPWVLKWHRSKRKKVVSDTTIERSLEGFNLEIGREILGEAYESLRHFKTSFKSLPSGKKLRVGIVDGSDFGGFLAASFTISGLVNCPLDLEPYRRGKELEATKNLLSRVKTRLGKGDVDIILGDALYLTKGHISQCKEELRSEVLIKTKEESLTIIEDAKGLFFRGGSELGDGIERVEGVDSKRMVKYQIIACGGFKWQYLPYEFKVAYVREEKFKPIKGRPEVEEFWVITTDLSLSAEDMRELAHFRWEIENNVFKRLNSLVGSKRGYIRNVRVKEALLLIWFLGLMLFGFCMMMRKLRGEQKAKDTWRKMTISWRDFLWKISSASALADRSG